MAQLAGFLPSESVQSRRDVPGGEQGTEVNIRGKRAWTSQDEWWLSWVLQDA